MTQADNPNLHAETEPEYVELPVDDAPDEDDSSKYDEPIRDDRFRLFERLADASEIDPNCSWGDHMHEHRRASVWYREGGRDSVKEYCDRRDKRDRAIERGEDPGPEPADNRLVKPRCTGWKTDKLPHYCRHPMCPSCWWRRQSRYGAAILASTGPYWHIAHTIDTPYWNDIDPAVEKRFHGLCQTLDLVCWAVAPTFDPGGDGGLGLIDYAKVGVFCSDRPVPTRNRPLPNGWVDREQFDNLGDLYDRWYELNPHPYRSVEHYRCHDAVLEIRERCDKYGHLANRYGKPVSE